MGRYPGRIYCSAYVVLNILATTSSTTTEIADNLQIDSTRIDCIFAVHIMNYAWKGFQETLQNEIASHSTSVTKKSALRNALAQSKIIALCSHDLFMEHPPSDNDDVLHPMDPDEECDFQNAKYANHFVSTGAALILHPRIVDLILCQFVGTDVRTELNQNAHFSGLDSCNIDGTRNLLFSANVILEDSLAVKAHVETYQTIVDIFTVDGKRTGEDNPFRKALANSALRFVKDFWSRQRKPVCQDEGRDYYDCLNDEAREASAYGLNHNAGDDAEMRVSESNRLLFSSISYFNVQQVQPASEPELRTTGNSQHERKRMRSNSDY